MCYNGAKQCKDLRAGLIREDNSKCERILDVLKMV